jgi:hypothetical protein
VAGTHSRPSCPSVDLAREVSAAMVTATMITQDDYGYGFGIFDLQP